MSLFVEWNRLLLAQFFPPAAKGEETYLQTTKAELDSIGLRLGGAEGLIAAVQEGPPWLARYQNVAEAANRLARQRVSRKHLSNYVDPGEVDDTYRGSSAPTYLPYLALWVLASSGAEVAGFYASVARMSRRPFSASNAIRDEMLNVWGDLERWSADCDGEFGVFALRVLGDHRFVGIPRSQCLISRKDKRGLPQLFWECRLRPRQDISDQVYRDVSTIAADAYYLSNGLKAAFNNPNYSDPLKRMLTAAFQSWDGKAPRPREGAGADHGQEGDAYEDAADEVALVLRPGQTTETDWEIHWRIPALVDAREFRLAAGGGRWEAWIEEAGTHASTSSAEYQAEARRILAGASDLDIEFTASFVNGDDENDVGVRKLLLPKCVFRALVWDVPDPNLGEELIEGEVPLAGPCYILFGGNQKGVLARLLGSSPARWESFGATGLPAGWELGCIHHCDLLSADERQAISENHVAHAGLARIQLVGGRPVTRGGGRTYPFYDLPIVELEAPANAILATEGLELTELGLELPPGVNRRYAPQIRRFALHIADGRRALFHIRVLVAGNTVACTTLKVSVPGGTGAVQGRNFGLDRLGRPSDSGDRLQGVLLNEDRRAIPGKLPTAPFAADQGNWKVLASAGDLQRITDSVAAKFLDSLAQLGVVAYGTARDQLLRLSHQARLAVHPTFLLLELRSRGFLEIETDDEGHLVRVHAVPPTLYTLPVQRAERMVRGVCGTLRLQLWRDLGDCLGGEVWLEDVAHPSLPVLRLAPDSEDGYADFVEMAGFKDACLPAAAIADWARGIVEARSVLGAWGWESLSTEIRHLQRFQPVRGEFVAQREPRLDIDPRVMASLYRFENPTIRGLQAYVLGVVGPDGRRQFSFLQDSRWGIWLALNSFAEFAKRECGIGDAVPWPIHYSASDGTLWLPARLRPPFVIERALVLCSASAPARTAMREDHISLVYRDMATGIWLAYRWVPERVAAKVAALLGAALAPVSVSRSAA